MKRNANGTDARNFFEIELEKNTAKFISTYSGENTNPLPSFVGKPREIILRKSTPNQLCEEIFATLNNEFRVATACVMFNKNLNKTEHYILNNLD